MWGGSVFDLVIIFQIMRVPESLGQNEVPGRDETGMVFSKSEDNVFLENFDSFFRPSHLFLPLRP